MKTTLAIFAFASTAHSQMVMDGDKEEVDIYRSKTDMSVAWDITYGSKSMLMRTLDIWAVNIYTTLSGDLDDNSYYQTYVSFPSKTEPGNYETVTCTKKYREGENRDDYDVRTYSGSNSFKYNKGENWKYDEINYDDYVDVEGKDWNFAGWHNKFDEDEVDDYIPDFDVDGDEWGCRSTRIFFAHGGLLRTIESYYPDEVDWIRTFDW